LRHHGVVIHGWLPTAGAADERIRTSESRVTTVCIDFAHESALFNYTPEIQKLFKIVYHIESCGIYIKH